MQLLKPGELIDQRYEVVQVLGTGAFGTVYKARQPQFDRLVAVKVLHRAIDNAEEVSRFEREAQAINTLKHRNIVAFYGFGVWNGAPYMVTELAHGENLFCVLSQTPQLERRRAIAIMQQVFSALSSAHQQGVIHRDLKPSNIILATTEDGSEIVKIIDFGLAKLLPGYGIPSQKLTETGFALGTVQYMSPEQCTGGIVDGRSDVYAAGCILYQCLTGRLPFEAAETVELMYQHLNAVARPLSEILPKDAMTEALQNFCDNCLSKEQDLRYASADEALKDLNAIAAGQSGKVKAFSSSSSSRRRATIAFSQQRSKKPLVLAAAAVALLLVTTGYFMLNQNEAPDVVHNRRAVHSGDPPSVAKRLDALAFDGAFRLPEQTVDELAQRLAKDERDHGLDSYNRARIAYMLCVHYQAVGNSAAAERLARIGWNERGRTTPYPQRSRNVLITSLITEGKFQEADELTRDLVKSGDPGTLEIMSWVAVHYANYNRNDRARALLESLLGIPTLPEVVRQHCYYHLGDANLAQGRPRDAHRAYEAGSMIGDEESSLTNPCWLGMARMALFYGDNVKAHEAVERISESVRAGAVSNAFPVYNGWVLMLADAANSGDRAQASLCAAHVQSRLGMNGRALVDLVYSFDEEQALKALNHAGYTDLRDQLGPAFDKHHKAANERSSRAKLQQTD